MKKKWTYPSPEPFSNNCTCTLVITWTQVNHTRCRGRFANLVRNGFQRGPQTVVGAAVRHDAHGREHGEHRENAITRRPPTGPTTTIHFPPGNKRRVYADR